MSTSLTLETAAQILAAQPFNRLIGAGIESFGDGAAELSVPVRDDLRQQFGYVHGGVLSYLVDNAITFAAGTTLGPAVLTGGFTVNYLAPADGAQLRARAAVVHATQRQAVVRCDVLAIGHDGAEKLCATGQGTVVTSPKNG